MMTAHLLSLDDLISLLCCAQVLQAKGNHYRYLADAAARYYSPRPISDLERDLGKEFPDGVEIRAGIGTLTISRESSQWSPAISQPKEVQRLQASPELAASRRSRCQECDRWANRCTVAGCSCAGLGDPSAALSRCPLNRWPS